MAIDALNRARLQTVLLMLAGFLVGGLAMAVLRREPPGFRCRQIVITAPDGKTYPPHDGDVSYGGGKVPFLSEDKHPGVWLKATDASGKVCLERGTFGCSRWSDEEPLQIEYGCGDKAKAP